MAEEEKDQNVGDESEQPKKKSKLVLFVIIGLVFALLAGGGYFAYTKFLAPDPAIEQSEVEKEVKEPIGEMFTLEPFVVNLSDPKGKRYLKVTIAIELPGPEVLESAEKAKPKLRDMIIMLLTSLSFEEVMTPEGKIRVRDELFERVNLILRPDRANNIYFTDFVIQ
nr:flagellar basal body-associated FliL family protein [Desulfobulbaceae bacterium]